IENSGIAQESSEYSNKSLSQAEGLMRIVDVLEAELLGAAKSQALHAAVADHLNIDDAIHAHLQWKGRLKNFISGNNTEQLKSSVVCQDDKCQLGQWIHGPQSNSYHNKPIFKVLQREHALFHKAAGEIVKAVENNDPQKAQKLMVAGGEFDTRTQNTISALQDLQDKKAKVA
ncbi:MAG: CZB domain-containing protein, partial [Bdellovibrio sp.]